MKKTFPVLLLTFFLVINFVLWLEVRHVRAPWGDVPPVPEKHKAAMLTLNDKQLAYRYYALMLQNLGSIGGRDVALHAMNYARLKEWLFLEDYLDPLSNTVPFMAAYYFGAIQDHDKLNHVLDYLAVVGQRPDNQKWRWLGQGVFIARHVMKDNDKALELAYKLAGNKAEDLGDWAKQMPAFVLAARDEEGDKELAYQIMLNILIDNVDTLHPNEINYMKDYICNTLLEDKPQSEKPELCD